MTRLRHHRLTHERHRPWYHYKAQAEISYFGVIGSNRWYKNSRRNYGAD